MAFHEFLDLQAFSSACSANGHASLEERFGGLPVYPSSEGFASDSEGDGRNRRSGIGGIVEELNDAMTCESQQFIDDQRMAGASPNYETLILIHRTRGGW